ncbi:hypothetical protein QTO34_015084 [Cnephaeus nilssonii]|uniref:Uncharacterized protein n=1 Tax=Cnephaeus nilssonii TaxID=3371016 RepID=A0AA40I3H2_CNENI|nr:hypothetical protein QTO34_015084 [Eptesicus nilssonii]
MVPSLGQQLSTSNTSSRCGTTSSEDSQARVLWKDATSSPDQQHLEGRHRLEPPAPTRAWHRAGASSRLQNSCMMRAIVLLVVLDILPDTLQIQT